MRPQRVLGQLQDWDQPREAIMRRKWTYTTREAAETAAREIGQQRDQLSVALNAVLHGESRNVDGIFGTEGSYYTFSLVPRYCGHVVIVTFFCPSTGQRPHTAAYAEEWVNEEIKRWTICPPTDELGRRYREGLYALRGLVNEANCAA
jgi:hypothetical protein